jgi:O-6-methylguanine DNA methyltransferase
MIDLYARNVEDVWFGVAYDGEEVFATNFASDGRRVLQGLLHSLPFKASFEQVEKPSAFAEHVVAMLKDVYDGKEIAQIPSLSMQHLSQYTQKVLKAASLIPLGYVASYGSVAKAAGGSPRGVGRVMALNPFAPIVPCHRVVGSDFSLVGYGGGLHAKLEFLKRERRGYTSEREIQVSNKRLKVFPVEFALKKADKR